MRLAAVRSIGTARGFRDEQDAADFEQEIVDQYALAMAAAGLTDAHYPRGTRDSVRVPAEPGSTVVDGRTG